MQAQRETAEGERLNENTDTIVFRSKGQLHQFRQVLIALVTVIFKPLMVMSIAVELAALLLGLLLHSSSLLMVFVFTAPLLLVCLLVLGWCVKILKGPLGNPVMTLSPEGLTLRIEPFLGTIPWDEIALVEPGRYLGLPTVIVMPKNKESLRARLGSGGRNLWMYAMPNGGLGFPCTTFGMTAADLAARINRYRERGL